MFLTLALKRKKKKKVGGARGKGRRRAANKISGKTAKAL